MRIRFLNMFFVGDELSYAGRVMGTDVIDGHHLATLDLRCSRRSDNASIVEAIV